MSATLATLRDRVELILADSGNAIWSEGDLDEAIRQALHEYSRARPVRTVTTLNVASSTRELDISSITGLLEVNRVWLPYTAADPEDPPNWCGFEHWRDLGILYIGQGSGGAGEQGGNYEPQAGDVARIFYTKLQTIKDLDSAAATSLPLEDESLIAGGAAGYAATSRAVDLAEQVTITPLTGQHIRAWGLSKLQEFRAGLSKATRSQAAATGAAVKLPGLDRHDGDWS